MGRQARGSGVTLAATGPALPLWAVLPPCFGLMLVLAAYVLALREAEVPESRRRIRTLGSVTMMLTQPLIVYVFAVATPANGRTFLLTWAMLVGLLGVLVILAMLDVLNNVRIGTGTRKEFHRELRDLESDVRRLVAEGRERSNESDRASMRLTGGEENRTDSERGG